MSIITTRNLWDEFSALAPVTTTLDAITGQSLRIPMDGPIPPGGAIWGMEPGANLVALFPDEKVQFTWAQKMIGDSLIQSVVGIRTGPTKFTVGFPEQGFLIIVGDFGGAAVLVARLIDSALEVLTFTALPSRDEMLRVTSDDAGGLVRLTVELWNGTSFDSLYFGQFGDMPALLGNLFTPAAIVATFDDQNPPFAPSPGDVIVYDDILIDSVGVTPPIPQTFPFLDDFEDASWS